MESIAGLFLEPPFLVLVSHKKWREDIGIVSNGLEVYNMESYEKLKAFEEERGRCNNLITNEYVVAQLQETFNGGLLREVLPMFSFMTRRHF